VVSQAGYIIPRRKRPSGSGRNEGFSSWDTTEAARRSSERELIKMTESKPVELSAIVSRDPEVHSGDLVFAGTRVPVDTLIDYLKAGSSIDQFLDGFPSVERRQVEAFLELSPEAVDQLRTRDPRAA
jgi:uncharacterized protein (DUF433 family)